MANPFVAEIRIVGFNFAPQGWALCNGQILGISQNTALFSLLGTTYGGDGRSNFALPDLQGRAQLGFGQGPGLSDYALGEAGGAAAVTLLTTEMPAHNHIAQCDTTGGNITAPAANNAWSAVPRGHPPAYTTSSANTQMSPQAIASSGGSQPHNNLSPYLVMNFVIAMQGIFPPRS